MKQEIEIEFPSDFLVKIQATVKPNQTLSERVEELIIKGIKMEKTKIQTKQE